MLLHATQKCREPSLFIYPARHGRLPTRRTLPRTAAATVHQVVVVVPVRRDGLGHEVRVTLVTGHEVANEPRLELVSEKT